MSAMAGTNCVTIQTLTPNRTAGPSYALRGKAQTCASGGVAIGREKGVTVGSELTAWGRRHTPATRKLSIRAELLENGGPKMWAAFMDELRNIHLGATAPKRSIIAELTAAYEREVASEAKPAA
jgi:hypothetical protein